MTDDSVVMRIVIQDDGKPSGPGSDATGGQSAHFTPSTAPLPQAGVDSRPATSAATGPAVAERYRQPAAPVTPTFPLDNRQPPPKPEASRADPLGDLAARAAGLDPKIVDVLRKISEPDPPTINQPRAPTEPASNLRINDPVPQGVAPPSRSGEPAFKVNAPSATPGPIPDAAAGAAGAGATADKVPPLPQVTKAPETWWERAAALTSGLTGAGGAAVGMAALAAVKFVDSQISESLARGRRVHEAGSQAAQSLARNDVVGAAAHAADGVAEVLETVPILGTVFGGLVRSASAVMTSFDGLARTFVDRGKELARYSPDIAMAQGRQTAREISADVREAQQLGPQYARMSDAYGELTVAMRELILPIKRFLMEKLAPIMEMIAGVIEIVGTGVEFFMALADAVDVPTFLNPLKMISWAAEEAIKAMREMIRLMKGSKKEEDLMEIFFRDAEAQFVGGDGKREVRFGDLGLGIGAFAKL